MIDGVDEPLVKSDLLARAGARHGFSTRAGGVSEGPFASLNLGFSVGDDPRRVEENHRRLAAAAGLSLGALWTVRQIHGDRVLECPAPSSAEEIPAPLGEADALLAMHPGAAVGIKTADCVPLLFFDPRTGVAAAAHAGWRGTVAHVAARAVEALAARGIRPADLLVALGPHIRSCCYEVGSDLAAQFESAFGAEVVRRAESKVFLDLALANRRILASAGIDPARIEILDACTSSDPGRWFSHRRDRGRTGRHLSFIAAR